MSRSETVRVFFSLALIALLAGAVYSNTVRSPFHFDDFGFIVGNDYITSFRSLPGIFHAAPARCLAFATFALNYRIGALDVFGYHLVNIAIHTANGMLLWYALVQLISAPYFKGAGSVRPLSFVPLCAALLFVAHPLQTQAVTYIYQRVTSLAAFWYLLTVCMYVRFRMSLPHSARRGVLYAFSLCTAAAAILTKENTATIPLMLWVCELYFLKGDKPFPWKRLAPFFLLVPAVAAMLMMTRSDNFRPLQALFHSPVAQGGSYFLTQFKVLPAYLGLLAVPLRQNLDYDIAAARGFFDPGVLAGFLLCALVIACAVRTFARHRLVSFGITWFFTALLVESGIIPLADDYMFEHRMYLPLAGFAMVAAYALSRLTGERSRVMAVAVSAALICGYAGVSYARNTDWQDQIRLLNDTVAKSPDKPRVYLMRAFIYSGRKLHERALADFQRAADLYGQRGGDAADSGLAKALAAVKPGDYITRYNLVAMRLMALGEGRFARILLKLLNAEYPDDALSYANLAVMYGMDGGNDEAITAGLQAVKLKPDMAQAHYNLAVAYYWKKEYAKARFHLDEAVRCGFSPDPEFVGRLLSESGAALHGGA